MPQPPAVMSFRVDAERLTRSRFALSRLAELTCGLEVLARPERAPHALGWVERARRRLEPATVAVALALAGHGSWYVPDFLVPIPSSYEPALEEELSAVAATPPHLVADQLRMAFRIGPPPPEVLRRTRAAAGQDPRSPLPPAVAAVLAEGGEAALAAQAAEHLRRCWEATMAWSWPAVRRVLDADVRHRAAEAGRVGFAEIVRRLHPRLDWDGSQVTLQLPYDVRVDAIPGLVLTPSVFLSRPAVWLGAPGQVMVGYPARGRAELWPATGPAAVADAGVLGGRRAALLADLGTPWSTSELAARHGLSPATVSYHLARLRQAGLVARSQAGRSVLYERTGRGTELLAALAPLTASRTAPPERGV